MDKEFKTTFIPKKNLSRSKVQASESKQSKARRSLFSILALLLFVTAVVSTVGVYLYKIQVATVINSRIESINRAEKAFEPAVILELKKLDIRLRAGTDLLNNHVAVSDFLDSLAESTLPDVSFSSFSFSSSSSGADISMSGEARGYLQISQQSDIFEDNQYIQNHIFSDFSSTDSGRVSFSLQFTLNPELLMFGRTTINDEGNTETGEGVIIPSANNQIPTGVDIDFNSFGQ